MSTNQDYFTYDTAADLAADARRLACTHVRLADSVDSLFEPLRIANLTLGNRLAIHPMEGCDGTLEGAPDELTLRRWDRFAVGGSKLIWGEAMAITEEGRANPRQLLINAANESALAALVARTRQLHRERFGTADDLVLVCQLTHSGRYSYRNPVIACHDPLLDAMTYRDRKAGVTVAPSDPVVSDAWLEQLEDVYVQAAERAYRIGFDAIDIKQCHRYLLNELLAARTRAGQYGGSFENRTRLVRNVLSKLRTRLGPRPVFTRLGVFDGLPYGHPSTPGGQAAGANNPGVPRPHGVPYRHGWGVEPLDPHRENLDEPLRWCRQMRDLGVSLISVSMGNPYANPHFGRPFEMPPVDGYANPEHPLLGCDRHFRLTGQVQRAVPEIAVMGAGYSWLRHFAAHAGAANLAAGDARLMGVGRGAFAYPEWAVDLRATGKLNPKRVCIAVSMCTTLMRAKANNLGQFPSGCVPRDKFYSPVYKEALKTLTV